MNTSLLVRLAIAAAAFSMAAAPGALAEDDCKDAVKAEGKPATLRDLGAYPNSLLAWRSAVKDKYGSEYNSWRYAKDRDVNCDQDDGNWICKRKAKPCKDVLHKVLDGATAAVKKDCKSESLELVRRQEERRESGDGRGRSRAGRSMPARNTARNGPTWDNAAGTDVDCHKVGGGLQCIAVGTPCMTNDGAEPERTKDGNKKSDGRDARPPLL